MSKFSWKKGLLKKIQVSWWIQKNPLWPYCLVLLTEQWKPSGSTKPGWFGAGSLKQSSTFLYLLLFLKSTRKSRFTCFFIDIVKQACLGFILSYFPGRPWTYHKEKCIKPCSVFVWINCLLNSGKLAALTDSTGRQIWIIILKYY